MHGMENGNSEEVDGGRNDGRALEINVQTIFGVGCWMGPLLSHLAFVIVGGEDIDTYIYMG